MSQNTQNIFHDIAMEFPANDQQWVDKISAGLTPTQLHNLGPNGLTTIAHVLANAFVATTATIKNYAEAVGERAVAHTEVRLNGVEAKIPSNLDVTQHSTDITVLQQKVTTLENDLQRLSARPTTGGGGSAAPKIGEPPEFSGSNSKEKYQDWKLKMGLWLAHHGIQTDKQRITFMLGKLSGTAMTFA